MIDRRAFGLGALALTACAAGPRVSPRDWRAGIAAIERTRGGRLGAYILDTGSGRSLGWREGERFGMCSTFKLSLAALVLRESDAGKLDLSEALPFSAADMVANSPVTRANLAAGRMTIGALAEATQKTSDNAAANLLMRRLGGPQALTAFWRSVGDATSRADRYEPAMNDVPPGEVRDTATPRGMATGVANFAVGAALTPASRDRLRQWMAETQTGLRRIRAAVPAGWWAGDKTGTANAPGMPNKVNDIAVLAPPGRAAIVVVGFYEADRFYDDTRPQDEAVLAELGRIAVAWAG